MYSEILASFENTPEGNVDSGGQVCLVGSLGRFSPGIQVYSWVSRVPLSLSGQIEALVVMFPLHKSKQILGRAD